MEYIQETNITLRLRFNEHLRDVIRKKIDTPMGDHFRFCHQETAGDLSHLEIGVLYRERDHPDWKIAESLLIRQQRPSLYSNVSSRPIM